jgi:hypothetical protein
MRLTRQTRNKVYEAVAKSSIDPAECNIQTTSYGGVLRHASGSTFEFGFDEDQEVFWVIATVEDGFQRTIDDGWDFDAVLSLIPDWANEINQVARTPDLWAELRRSRELAVEIQRSDIGNSPFTNDERRQIVAELEAIKEQVNEQFDLTSEQTARIDEWKDEVAEASERIGRKDWRLLAYGTVINLVVTDALPPEVARHMLSMFIQVIAHLFLGGGGPTGILA